MTLSPSHAEDSCLKYQASSGDTGAALGAGAATAGDSNSNSNSDSNQAPTPTAIPASSSTPASTADYYTLGSSGIASGHHHAYLPDPWVVSSTSNSTLTNNHHAADYLDSEKSEAHGCDSLVAGAARFAAKRPHTATSSSAVAAGAAALHAGSPMSVAASSVSAVGSMADAEQSSHSEKNGVDVPEPAPVRLVRTVTFGDNTAAAAAAADAAPEDAARTHSSYSHTSDFSASSSSASSAPTDDLTSMRVTFPEGGRQAWQVVFASFCAMVSVFGLINSSAVFESWFSTHQLAEYTASEIGWIFSTYLFIVFFIGIQVGPIFDRYGPRWLVFVGSVLVVASVMLLGLCEEYYQIMLCYSVLGGLGGALLNTPAYACIAHFFNVRRGLATGIATTSGGVGGIAFPILMQQLLPRLGFAWSTRILGFILLGLSVPANLWLRTRLPLPGVNDCGDAETATNNTMPTMTQSVSNINDSAASVRTVHTVRTAHSGVSARSSIRRLPSVWPDFTIFRDRRYAVAAVGIFFMEWGIFVPLTFIVSYANAHNQDTSNSYTMLSLLNAGSVLGRVLPGLAADKVGRFNVIILTIAMSSAVVFGAWLPAGDSRTILIVFAVLFGFASGSNLGLIAVCLGQLCEPSQYGRYYSTAMMVASFGTLSSVPIGGAILGDGNSEKGWQGLILFGGVSYAIALVCYITARVMAVGWSYKAKF
ncbi:riboflavin transporter mch5 [Ophiostoma piceae UAMH 11346]|uniref:Riboflavin transporter mch5 n=1 Tax=Ophiostoma piceae (strain UAMH 11346) TaxID=1262450 RepID=S3CDS8_OPHP1|nr:riboflavin transporter mch5 [Ophiostoma piceae UAMH 11346]